MVVDESVVSEASEVSVGWSWLGVIDRRSVKNLAIGTNDMHCFVNVTEFGTYIENLAMKISIQVQR